MAWLCSTQRALPAPSLSKTPSHLEFARWPEGASLPPPGHPFWCARGAARGAGRGRDAARRSGALAGKQPHAAGLAGPAAPAGAGCAGA